MAELRRTLCNRDCPDTCGIVAEVEQGRVTRLRGDPDHPVTRGFLCYRTQQFLHRQYDADRLTAPLLRKDGVLAPVSWDEALDHVAERLLAIRAESGPAAIFHYRSGGSLGMLVAQASDLFFERFGPVTVKRGDICSGAGEAAQALDFGVSDSSQLSDLLNARHILIWGKNVHCSSPHTLPVLKQARARGAQLTLIDPTHHQGVRLCHRFIQPRPAGDFALAMAVARILFERDWLTPDVAQRCLGLKAFVGLAQTHSVRQWCAQADVSADAAIDLAQQLRDGPTSILIGWGMARRISGGAIVRALDALAAISGNLGRPGAGASYYFQRKRAFTSLTRGAHARTICEPLFGPEVLAAHDPPIRAIWVTAGNPAAMLPQAHTVAEALRSRELTVVVDSWLSDSAALADVVLPVNTLLEADDLLGAYGHHTIGVAQPVVPPPPGVKSDLEIFQALAPRVGLDDVMPSSAEAFKQRLLSEELGAHGIDLATLRDSPQPNPLAPEVLFQDGRFATASGKIELLSEAPPPAPAHDEDFPLTLMSLSTPKSQSSQWARHTPERATVTVHPDAAAGIGDGELALLESALGHITVKLTHDPRQRRDVALIPKGGHLRSGSCANALIRARTTDIGEGGALYDERVRLRPVLPSVSSLPQA